MLVSFGHCNNEYEKSLLPFFDKRIEITNDVENIRMLQVKAYNRSFKRKEESRNAAVRKETLTLVTLR